MASANPGDDGASSSVIAFMIAGVLFMASVVAVLVTTNNSSGTDSTGGEGAQNARFAIQSTSLAEILLESPGYYQSGGATSPLDWSNAADYNGKTADADNLARLGLLDSDSPQPFMMDYAKFQNLRRAGFYANPTNGYVDYEEASETLGLADSGLDFHVRAYPTLESVADLLNPPASKDTNLRVTYIGDIDVTRRSSPPPEPLIGLDVGTPTCGISPLTSAGNPQAYRISVEVVNNGVETTQFSALVEYELGDSSNLNQNTNSYLVAPGDSTFLFVDVPAKAGTSCTAGSNIHFHVQDPETAVVETQTELPTATATGATVAPTDLWLDTTKPNFQNPTAATSGCSDPVKLTYSGKELPKDRYVYLVVSDSAGAPVYQASQKIPASANQRTFTAGCLIAGEYLGTLYYCGTGSCTGGSAYEQVVEQILVTMAEVSGFVPAGSSAATGAYTYTPTITPPATRSHAEIEVEMLDLLIQNFCPTYYNSQTLSPLVPASTPYDWDGRCRSFKQGMVQYGDVLPDSHNLIMDDLAPRLVNADGTPRYDITNVLVVGSRVSHTALTSEVTKGPIEAWVRGGGTIIALGTDNGNTNWMGSLFHAATRGGGGPISTPDQGHPMLHTPNELDNPADNYDPRDTTWRFNGQTAIAQDDENTAVFTNVVVAGEDETDPLLATSNTGSFGGGSIIITAYMPWDLYNDPVVSSQPAGSDCPGMTRGECEGLRFMHNLLMQGYADLYLDYGPSIPGETDVTPAQRTAQINHPQLGDVVLTIIVYVF